MCRINGMPIQLEVDTTVTVDPVIVTVNVFTFWRPSHNWCAGGL